MVPRPANHNVVLCKLVFKVKEEQKPAISLSIRYQERRVSRGFSQVICLDYTKTLAPVIKFTMMVFMLSIVSQYALLLHQSTKWTY